MSHSHHHHTPETGKRLGFVVVLNFSITIIEIIGGIAAGSLSLISDALHNLSDGVAIIIAWVAIRLQGKPRTDRSTFGLKRAELVAATVNAGTLVGISIYLFIEAAHRFSNPEPVSGGLMVGVALFGLLANIAGTLLLKRGAEKNLNLRAAYLHLLSDALSSVGVIVGGIAIVLWNITWIDPVLTVLIAAYVLRESVRILWHVLEIFMQFAPKSISIDDLRQAISTTHGVVNVHHIHLWQLSEHEIHLEAHIETTDRPLGEVDALRQQLTRMLNDSFAIGHITLQMECADCQCPTKTLT